MKDRLPVAPGRHIAVVDADQLQKLQKAEPFTITLTRDDQPVEAGTPYSKAAVLPDDVAEKLCTGVEDPTPADAFRYIGNAQLGSSREAFAAFVSSFDGYKDTNGDLIQRAGCKVYRLMMDKNEKLYGKTVRIKTYAYGDMVYGWNDHGQYIPINPNANIEETPRSGIREFEVTFPEYNADDPYEVFDVSFCENPYTDFAIYEKKGTIWEELKKLQSVEGYDAFESVLTSVKYEKQNLTPAQQAQARENIGVTVSAPDYYSTTREESDFKYFKDIKSTDIFGLYDELMVKHPGKVKKNEVRNYDGTFTNYEYVISTGEYSTEGYYCGYGEPDPGIKKPKYLISSGIHGHESVTVLYLYRFIRDVLDGHNVPNSFKEGAILHILPVINPWGLDHFSRRNENGVDINRNFKWNWEPAEDKSSTPDIDESVYAGTEPESEKETQVVVNWLKSHTDADLWIDLHNSALTNEPVSVLGCANDMVDTAKKIALRGIDKIIPFWRDVIGYPTSVETYNGIQDLIYSYAATMEGNGTHYAYAPNVLGLNTICLEIMAYNGNYSEWATDKPVSTENVAMGAEILGNVLIEFYNESFASEVVDMTEVNKKLDNLLAQVNSGFRVESGVYTVAKDTSGSTEVSLPCKGAKVFVFESDVPTREVIRSTSGGNWLIGTVGQLLVQLPFGSTGKMTYGCYASMMKPDGGVGATQNNSLQTLTTDDGVKFACGGLKAGTYKWSAYYWNE